MLDHYDSHEYELGGQSAAEMEADYWNKQGGAAPVDFEEGEQLVPVAARRDYPTYDPNDDDIPF